MEMKFTPGPWIGAGPSFGDALPRYTTEIITEIEDEDGNCATICELPFRHHDVENEANARLIAAAPELLDALLEIEMGIGPFHQDPLKHAGNVIESMQAVARAAIAKALGE